MLVYLSARDRDKERRDIGNLLSIVKSDAQVVEERLVPLVVRGRYLLQSGVDQALAHADLAVIRYVIPSTACNIVDAHLFQFRGVALQGRLDLLLQMRRLADTSCEDDSIEGIALDGAVLSFAFTLPIWL